MNFSNNLLLALSLVFSSQSGFALEVLKVEDSKEYETFDARQAVAVDKNYFYAINNFRITKHDKSNGEPVVQWDGGSEEGPLIHLDSGMIWDGKLYAAHSNYPRWPMTSSVEIWDAETLEHVGSHSFGIDLGSFTWLDRHDGSWWAGFGNYDKIQPAQNRPYGQTINTQIVKMDDSFNILQRWTLPEGITQRIAPMSNSGGSWGPDGYLYLSGHDHPEIYVMQLPMHGSELEWVATVEAPEIHGQGIAWDRSGEQRVLWGIRKRERMVYRMTVPPVVNTGAANVAGVLRRAGHFNKE